MNVTGFKRTTDTGRFGKNKPPKWFPALSQKPNDHETLQVSSSKIKMETKVNSENEDEMIKSRNLDSLSEELNMLHQYCVDSDINAFKTLKVAKPFMNWQNKRRKWSCISSLFALSFLVILTAVALSHDSVIRNICSTVKYLHVLLVPWLDWTWLYSLRCLIPNPIAKDMTLVELQEEDCQLCTNITSINQIQHIEMEDMCNAYLLNKIPLVFTNQNVHRNGEKTINDIKQMYLGDEILNVYACCKFSSNVENVQGDQRVFLSKLNDGKFSQFYAHWQNCFAESSKLFRKVYNRPAFLPSTVELSRYNWVFLSSDYTEDQTIPVPFTADVIIMVQISGYLDVLAEPKEPCQGDCKNLGVRLQPRSVLIAPTHLYEYKYRPPRTGQSLTVGLEGSIDL